MEAILESYELLIEGDVLYVHYSYNKTNEMH